MNDNRIWLGKDGKGVPRVKRFLSEMPQGVVPQTWLKYEDVGSGQDGTKDLKDKFNGEMVFNFPKPIKLMKFIIDRHKNKNALILDFFAGTGTTGQAVIELNKEDKGNRKFILCTNNENKICEELTYTRLVNSKVDNLKYYKTDYIPRVNTESDNIHVNLLENIKYLIQLDNGIDIDNKEIKIITDELKFDEFTENESLLNECNKLYISSDILMTNNQEHILENNNIEVFVIPEYYFKDEIMEVTE